jgi:hypothetical protein
VSRYDPPEQFAVYEREALMNRYDDGIILGNFNSKEEAEEARIKYGFTSDNYYVDIV